VKPEEVQVEIKNYRLEIATAIALITLLGFLLTMTSFIVLLFAFGKQGLNGHLFGSLDFFDFYGLMAASREIVIPWNGTTFDINPWAGDSPTPYSSIGLFIFKVIAILIPNSPQSIVNSGLIFNLLGAMSLCFPIFDSLKPYPKTQRLLIGIVISCLSYPSILGFSRANIAVLFVTPIYIILKNTFAKKPTQRYKIILSLVFVVGIKFSYAPLLLLYVVKTKRREIFYPTISLIIGMYLLSFAFFTGNIVEMISGHIQGLLSFSQRIEPAQNFFFNTSLNAGMLTFFAIVMGVESVVVIFLLNYSFVIALCYMGLVLWILIRRRCPYWYQAFLLMSVIALAPPISYAYNSTYLMAIFGLVFLDHNLHNILKSKKGKLNYFAKLMTGIGLLFISASDFFWIEITNEIATSSKSLTIPIGTILMLFTSLLFDKKRDNLKFTRKSFN
jgi:hypothetical protein